MSQIESIKEYLKSAKGVVEYEDILNLNNYLSNKNDNFILMLGNCAEVMSEIDASYVNNFQKFYSDISSLIKFKTSKDVLKIGRYAGQFGKTRSNDNDEQGHPVYRGDIYNGINVKDREKDDSRKVRAYVKSRFIIQSSSSDIYSSHELFEMDYEESLLRETQEGYTYTSSAHLLWLAEKNFSSEKRVGFLSRICNPVGIKVGPKVSCENLNFIIERLTRVQKNRGILLISRMGVNFIEDRLPKLLEVTKNNKSVRWICDPMHGNNKKFSDGKKVRYINDIIGEMLKFKNIYGARYSCDVSGIMLESMFGDFLECLENKNDERRQNYKSYCDPRLNKEQVIDFIEAVL